MDVRDDQEQPPHVEQVEFSPEELNDIRNNLSDQIGNDEFGVVHKGFLNGQTVAVKILDRNRRTLNDQEFRNEFNSLRMLVDTNIARYIGYCYDVHQQEWLLCCEYLTTSLAIELDGPLHFDNWDQRLKIIKGISLGLCYLHERPNDPILNFHLKPDNIFLDEHRLPKIAYFGQSRLFENALPQEYIAPECHTGVTISTESDVFCLGIVMLEILTGNKRSSFKSPDSIQHYITQVRKDWSKVSNIKSKYPSLHDERIKEVSGCIAIGLECLQFNPTTRPKAREINNMLSRGSPLSDGLIFWVDESSRKEKKIGYMLSAGALTLEYSNVWIWHSSTHTSRFAECAELNAVLRVTGKIPIKYLLLDTPYIAYLVYKSVVHASQSWEIVAKTSIDPNGSYRIEYTPKDTRDDGWMELELTQFSLGPEHVQWENTFTAEASISVSRDDFYMKGFIIGGMELRPY